MAALVAQIQKTVGFWPWDLLQTNGVNALCEPADRRKRWRSNLHKSDSLRSYAPSLPTCRLILLCQPIPTVAQYSERIEARPQIERPKLASPEPSQRYARRPASRARLRHFDLRRAEQGWTNSLLSHGAAHKHNNPQAMCSG